jgi:hypothetical protein
MKEIFRDKSRDRLAQSLSSLGIRVDLAERGRSEERYVADPDLRSNVLVILPADTQAPPAWSLNNLSCSYACLTLVTALALLNLRLIR